jgi:hypothetical protein
MSDAFDGGFTQLGCFAYRCQSFGMTTFARAVVLFASYLVFVTICVWADSRTQ